MTGDGSSTLSWTSAAATTIVTGPVQSSTGSAHGLLVRKSSHAAEYRELCLVQGMEVQLLEQVLQLLYRCVAPEKCITPEQCALELLPLLTSCQNGEHILSATPASNNIMLGWPGHHTRV